MPPPDAELDRQEAHDASIPPLPFAVTFFRNFGAATKHEETYTLASLAHRIRAVTAGEKSRLPWLKLARFGDARSDKSSLRHDGNVLAITGIEADYDAGKVTLAEAVEVATKAGVLCLIYTSPSHTEAAPRWRVLCPTSCELPPERRDTFMGWLNGLFGGIFSGESWTLSQSYYFGSITGNTAHRVELIAGEPIDELDEMAPLWLGKPNTETRTGSDGKPRSGPVDEVALLAEITSGASYHEAAVRLLGKWALDGVALMDARARLVDAMEAVFPPDRDARWKVRRADVDRCLTDIYGKEAKAKDQGKRRHGKPASQEAHAEEDTSPNQAATGERPVIRIIAGQIKRIVDEAEAALIGARLDLYQRGSFIVRPGEAPVILSDGRVGTSKRAVELGEHGLMEAMTTAASWEKYDARSENWVAANAPMTAVKAYRDRKGQWKLPVLMGIISAPTLRSDGTLLATPGYDPHTGLLLVSDGTAFPAMPGKPTKRHAEEALSQLRGLIDKFPFVSDEAHSVALSAFLTACIRRALPTAPMHAFSAPIAGSGKSMLVDLASIIVSGREAGVIAQGQSEQEMEKRLGSLLLGADPVIAIDNCEAPLGGEFLCQLLTQTVVRTRILGRSEAPELPSNSFVTATGNNLALIGDVTRRALLCKLDPKHERPELRQFAVNPIAEAKARRGELLIAALTVLRAYHIADRPEQPKALGSFEAWSDWVRGALIWLEEADPVATMEEARKADPKLEAVTSVITQWHEVIGSRRVTVRDIIEHATTSTVNAFSRVEFRHPDFREALLTVAGEGGAINSKRLGKWLAANKDRIVLGCRIMQDGERGGSTVWQLNLPKVEPAVAA